MEKIKDDKILEFTPEEFIDRLKTLEDKVKELEVSNEDNQDVIQQQGEMIEFIMENSKVVKEWSKPDKHMCGIQTFTLQDLWDEENKKKLNIKYGSICGKDYKGKRGKDCMVIRGGILESFIGDCKSDKTVINIQVK